VLPDAVILALVVNVPGDLLRRHVLATRNAITPALLPELLDDKEQLVWAGQDADQDDDYDEQPFPVMHRSLRI